MVGLTELIAIAALLGSCFAWLTSSFDSIDKRFDKVNKDLNGLGARLDIFEQGTVELIEEKLNQLKTKQFEIDTKLDNLSDSALNQTERILEALKDIKE